MSQTSSTAHPGATISRNSLGIFRPANSSMVPASCRFNGSASEGLLHEKPQRGFVEFVRRFPDDQMGGVVDQLGARARFLFLQEGATLRRRAAVLLAVEQQQRHGD